MTPRILAATCLLALLSSGCRSNKITPLKVSTEQHSPVRMHVYEIPDAQHTEQLLLLPPLGIEDPALQKRFQRMLYSAAQRHFTTPIKLVMADSAYAPYTDESNLLCNDGTLNMDEISIIGNLMKSVYVLCPIVRELKPYHPQRVDIQILLINAPLNKVCAELSCVFDARDVDTFNYFMDFSKSQRTRNESRDDLAFRIKSPEAFQRFVADLCSSVMAEKLPF